MRRARIVAGLLLRRGNVALRVIAVTVGVVLGLSVSTVFAVAAMLGHVDARGTARQVGTYAEDGCIQASYVSRPFLATTETGWALAAGCEAPAIPPGLAAFPRPREVYLSPALMELRATDARVRARYPSVSGVIDRPGLAAQNDVYVLVGVPFTGGSDAYTFDRFGSSTSYLEDFLRFDRPALLILGLFFTLVPGIFLVTGCARLSARIRERQLSLLTVIGADRTSLRSGLALETAVAVGCGSAIGVAAGRWALAGATPTFVGWEAFPGDLAVSPLTSLLALGLTLTVTLVAAAHGARVVVRTSGPSQTEPQAS